MNFVAQSDVKNESGYFSDLDAFKQGNFCEYVKFSSTDKDTVSVFVAKIELNISGRLKLAYKHERKLHSVYLFYTDRQLRHLGWAKSNGLDYINYDVKEHGPLKPRPPQKTSTKLDYPQFKLNCFMECLYKNKFYAARVVDVSPNVYFKLKLECTEPVFLTFFFNESDLMREKSDSTDSDELEFVYSNSFHSLFPCKWCVSNNLNIEAPPGWSETIAFDWGIYQEKYLTKLNDLDSEKYPVCLTKPGSDVQNLFGWSKDLSRLAEKFQIGMYVEYDNGARVLLAQIRARVAHLLFLRVVGEDLDKYSLEVVPVDSNALYPVAWCEMNNYYEMLKLSYESEYPLPFAEHDKNKLDRKRVSAELSKLMPNEVALRYLDLIKSKF